MFRVNHSQINIFKMTSKNSFETAIFNLNNVLGVVWGRREHFFKEIHILNLFFLILGLLYVNILFWYGVHKMRHQRYIEAKQLLNNAYNYSTKIKGLSPKQEMVILYTLADINSEMGDYKIALTSMLDAIVLGKGIGSVDLPLCYLKLGYIYQKLEVNDRARACFQEAKTQGELYGFGEVVTEAITALSLLTNKNELKTEIVT